MLISLVLPAWWASGFVPLASTIGGFFYTGGRESRQDVCGQWVTERENFSEAMHSWQLECVAWLPHAKRGPTLAFSVSDFGPWTLDFCGGWCVGIDRSPQLPIPRDGARHPRLAPDKPDSLGHPRGRRRGPNTPTAARSAHLAHSTRLSRSPARGRPTWPLLLSRPFAIRGCLVVP
jgi:hypothetical protein